MIEAAPAYRILTAREVLLGPDGLDGINTEPLNQGAVVLAAGAFYRLDRNSSAVADGLTVIQPSAGPGRWVATDVAGSAAVANVATLASLGVASPDLVWVESVACYWHRNARSTLPADGITVAAAIGGGNWERLVYSTAPQWLAQATWYIDPLLGGDENVGDAGHPLATFAELDRRWSAGPLRQATTITVAAGALVPVAELDVDTDGYLVTIVGTTTVLRNGVVNTYAERVHTGAPTPSLLTDAGVADWTSEKGVRLRISSGARENAIAWVAAENPGGAGVNVAATCRFGGVPPATNIPPIVVPLHGDTYVVESLPTINHLSLYQRPGRSIRSVNEQLAFHVKNLALGQVNQARVGATVNPTFQVAFDGCAVDAYIRIDSIGSATFTRCKYGGSGTQVTAGSWGPVTWRCSLFVLQYNVFDDKIFSLWQSLVYGVVATSGAINQGSVTYGLRLQVKINDSQFFDTLNGPAINFILAGDIWCRFGLSGARNKFGVYMGDGSDESLGDQYFFWSDPGDLPNLLGTTADIRILGSTNIDLAWSAMPFRSDEQRGTASLAAGTVIVSARNALLRGVEISLNTPGGTPGFISAPVATRTASQFVINSTSNLDTSTVDWRVLPMARQVVMCQGNSIG